MKNYLVIALSVFLHLLNLIVADQNTRLLFVQILFRHGDRSPIELYPTDPNPESLWTEGLGKLTILGRKQHYALGKYFRSRYQNFTTSSPLEVIVSSSYVDRCLKSAATNLASFFAPDTTWEFDAHLSWQPIAIHYIPTEIDKYLETNSYCPRANAEQVRVLNTPGGQHIISEHKAMFENLTYYSGNPITNWTTASYLHDVLLIERKYNLMTPSWALPYWNELNDVADLSFFWSYNSPLLHRLRAGPLLQKMIENIRKKMSGDTPNLKFHIFSGHDTNIAVVLGALNLFNMKQPPYCATLLFELHEMSDGTRALRLLYLNSTNPENEIQEPHLLVLKGCSEYCPLDFFINFTRDIIPEDWERECQLEKSFVEKIQEKQVTIGWIFILVAVIITTMSVYTIWRIHSRKQDKKGGSSLTYSLLDSS